MSILILKIFFLLSLLTIYCIIFLLLHCLQKLFLFYNKMSYLYILYIYYLIYSIKNEYYNIYNRRIFFFKGIKGYIAYKLTKCQIKLYNVDFFVNSKLCQVTLYPLLSRVLCVRVCDYNTHYTPLHNIQYIMSNK